MADEAPRPPEGAKMSPKESPKDLQRGLPTIEATVASRSPHGRVTDFGAGTPQGRPRARGVYLINQVKKE